MNQKNPVNWLCFSINQTYCGWPVQSKTEWSNKTNDLSHHKRLTTFITLRSICGSLKALHLDLLFSCITPLFCTLGVKEDGIWLTINKLHLHF